MWINEEKKLIFLCNPKCGSTTIREQLKNNNFINIGKEQQKICKGH